MMTFGEHKGGQLRAWTQDEKKKPVNDLAVKSNTLLGPHRKPIIFDGTQAHDTSTPGGERVVIIFFKSNGQIECA